VLIFGRDVWLVRPDGTGRLLTTLPWAAPSLERVHPHPGAPAHLTALRAVLTPVTVAIDLGLDALLGTMALIASPVLIPLLIDGIPCA
jgi:hypothetical protein